MFCLLCHEKVSRLRAWRTKSEFCCDEHAEIYKRQTLERLLTDQEDGKPGEALPLLVDSKPRGRSDSSPVSDSVAETLARFSKHDTPAAPPAAGIDERLNRREHPKQLGDEDRDEGVRELWRLAEEVGNGDEGSNDDWATEGTSLSGNSSPLKPDPFGGFGGGSQGGSGGVTGQTPEEALAALRELSARRSKAAAPVDSGNGFDALVAARESSKASRAENLAKVEERPFSLDDELSDEDSLPPFDMGALDPLDDDELPSILDRLTETDPAGVEFNAAAETVELADDLEPLSELGEPPSEWLPAREEQPAEAVALSTVETGEVEAAPPAIEEPLEAASLEGDSGAFDLLEEAVESHLEELEEKPAERGGSRKVVPFPLSLPKPAGTEPAAASGARGRPEKSGNNRKGKSKAADLSRVQLKPVAVMFGIEPSLSEPAGNGGQMPSGLAALAGQNNLSEPLFYYPVSTRPRFDARLPVYSRLLAAFPETVETPSERGEIGRPDTPEYSTPCMTPLPLALGSNGKRGTPSLGSERAWMVRIEPQLAEGFAFEVPLPNGEQHTPWRSPRLPAALLAGVVLQNGSGKLDLSGSAGRYEPPVDRLFMVFPELGELGGSARQSSSKTKGETPAGWMPPTVLDPRFDIERPAGRDLSDFG